MNRELKFRAWTGKEMVLTADFFDEHADWGQGFLRAIKLDQGDGSYELIPLMQFTGLKDRNGKEIYEGDIVRKEEWQPPMEFCGYTVFTVEFNSSAFRYVPLKRFNNGWILDEFDTVMIEVIGNIYENPELL